ncbi:MAG TPA: DegV family protein [Anaerolineaceae bacterium]|nr:DegV family protein [Anaerolineaceae bacterium]
MTKISIITDTDASLPKDIAEQYDITQVPITIHFGESTYTTGVDINDAILFEIIDQTNKLPTTSAPPPAVFERAYQNAFDNGFNEVICICVSSRVSATYQAAVKACEQFPEKEITVVDSLQLSLAQGLIVLAAAKAAKRGANKDEILNEIDEIKRNLHVYAALPTLKYLAMGGRVGKFSAGIADTLNIKPILSVQEGKLELLEKVRTMKKAKLRLIDLASKCLIDKKIKQIGFIHVNNLEGVKELHKELCDVISCPQDPIIAEFTPGLSVHAGSGVIGFVIHTE